MKKTQRPLPDSIAAIRRNNARVSAGLLGLVLAAFTVAGLFAGEVFASAERPALTEESFRSGAFAEDYAGYVNDRFAGRDKWLGMRTQANIVLQKREYNGVYLGQDGYLFEKHAASAYTGEQLGDRLDALEALTRQWDTQVCLVPTADNILTDKLPVYADVRDDTELLRSVWERIGMDHYIDVYSVLLAHQDEELYYRTDEHWTSLGAHYAYLAWTQAAGVKEKYFGEDAPAVASETFVGSLSTRSGLPVEKTDSILYYPLTERHGVTIVYDRDVISNTYYNEAYLDTENGYNFFLDGDHAQTVIRAGSTNGRTLFVIRDSWANTLLPMLAAHYETVIAVEPELLDEPLSEYMERCAGGDDMDVLVLYSCEGFLEHFDYN